MVQRGFGGGWGSVIILHLACQPAPDDRHSRLGRESRQPKKPVPSRSWLFCASPPSSRDRWTALAAARHRRRRLDTFGGRTQNTSSRGKTHSVSKKGGIPADLWTQNASSRPKTHSVSSHRRNHLASFLRRTTDDTPCIVFVALTAILQQHSLRSGETQRRITC
jgi:hypothetical protein